VFVAIVTFVCPLASADDAKDEIRKLKAENRLLKKELYRLRREVKALRSGKGRTRTTKRRAAKCTKSVKRQTATEKEAAEIIGSERIEKLGNLMASLGSFMGMDPSARQEAIANLRANAKEMEGLFSGQ